MSIADFAVVMATLCGVGAAVGGAFVGDADGASRERAPEIDDLFAAEISSV